MNTLESIVDFLLCSYTAHPQSLRSMVAFQIEVSNTLHQVTKHQFYQYNSSELALAETYRSAFLHKSWSS